MFLLRVVGGVCACFLLLKRQHIFLCLGILEFHDLPMQNLEVLLVCNCKHQVVNSIQGSQRADLKLSCHGLAMFLQVSLSAERGCVRAQIAGSRSQQVAIHAAEARLPSETSVEKGNPSLEKQVGWVGGTHLL